MLGVFLDKDRRGCADGGPPAHSNPLLEPDIPNLIVTPHSAWASRESRQRLVQQLAENIQVFFNGHPVRVVV